VPLRDQWAVAVCKRWPVSGLCDEEGGSLPVHSLHSFVRWSPEDVVRKGGILPST